MFDEYQKNAIYNNEDKVLLVASPGSGKTTVLVEKLTKLVKDGVSGENILLMTFTKKACENMKERFAKQVNISILPNFYTFHSLFYNIVKTNINKNIGIIEDYDIEIFLKGFLRKYVDIVDDKKVKSIMTEISRFNSSRQSIEEFDSVFSKDFFREVNIEYSKFKEEKNIYDFDDLGKLVLKLFENDIRIRDLYVSKFKYILVDEFQDCDDVQIEFLKTVSENSKLFCVGDEDQSIYKFRGANPNAMVDFCDIFKNGKKYYLKYNYRSTSSIIEFSRNVISNNKIRNKKYLIGKKEEEGEVICKKFLEDREQGNYIVKDIIKLRNNGFDLSDFAILYRNHSDCISILSEFIKNKIKIRFLDDEFTVFNQFYIEDIINFLLFIEESSINNFEKIYSKTKYMFSRKLINVIKKYDYCADIFSIAVANFDIITINDKRSLYNLKNNIYKLRKLNLVDRIKNILNKIGYSLYLENLIKSKDLDKERIDYFLGCFNDIICKFNSVRELKDGINFMESDYGVNFGTIHASKGMEFKCVYIINSKGDIDLLGNLNTIYDEEEERRIFYVGITRAIDRLRILSPYFINGKFFEKPLKFIDEGLECKKIDNKLFSDNDVKINKIDKNKVLLYVDGKKKKMDTRNFLNIT